MSFEVGQTVTAQTVVTTLAGTPVNTPAVTLTVTAPDGTVTTPAVTNTGAGGVYTALVPATLPGTYLLSWVASGSITAAHQDQFYVSTPGVQIISLADAKAQINARTAVNDNEIRDYIDAVTNLVEGVTGPVLPREHVEMCTPFWGSNGEMITLANVPVVSVTSIVSTQPDFPAPLLSDLILNPQNGMLSRIWSRSPSYPGRGQVRVTYIAGRSSVPPSVGLAARIIFAHMWETQHNRSAGRPTPGGDDENFSNRLGYSMPYRAQELLEPYRRGPQVA
jgi:uncharacterized phiE125 gp8 family phage protein